MFLSSADFLKNLIFQKTLSGTQSASNGLDPDQAQKSVGPDLGPNCSKRLSADDKSPLAGEELRA